MQITRATDYAVRIMIHLAALPEETRLAAPELARGIQAPESFVSKVLQQLVQRGMVTSHRGAGGGFQLAVAPESVSLLERRGNGGRAPAHQFVFGGRGELRFEFMVRSAPDLE